jgi:hypothetical protein
LSWGFRTVQTGWEQLVVKTKNPDTLIENLKQTFENLKKWKWKLNPNKCVFGVPSGQLLGFLVSHHGIQHIQSSWVHPRHHASLQHA